MSRKHHLPDVGLDSYATLPRGRRWPRFKFWHLVAVAVAVGMLAGWLLARWVR